MNKWNHYTISDTAAQVLSRLEQTRKDYWNIHPDAAAVLVSLLITNTPQKILEIGTSNGFSAILMGSIAQRFGGFVTTLEFYDERVHLARKHIEEAGVTNVTIIQGDAREVVQTLPEGWDMVFIDAGKADYGHYFKHIFPKLSAKGCIVADNTISHRKSMNSFFQELEAQKNILVSEIPVGDGLLIVKKI